MEIYTTLLSVFILYLRDSEATLLRFISRTLKSVNQLKNLCHNIRYGRVVRLFILIILYVIQSCLEY